VTLTEEITQLIAGQHGCGMKDPCDGCRDATKQIKRLVALSVHVERFEEGRVDTFYAGITRARITILDGDSL
jgi:hypothetical protein